MEPLICFQDGLHIAGPVAAFFGQLGSYIDLFASHPAHHTPAFAVQFLRQGQQPIDLVPVGQ
jgi:hypothetical protein